MAGKKKIVSVKVSGRDATLWQELRQKFILALQDLLDSVVDSNNNNTMGQEIVDYSSALLDYGSPKLAKDGLANERTIAEIESLYARKLKELAETKKINAETDRMIFETKMRRLKAALTLYKMVIVGEEGEEQIFISKQLDTMILALGELGGGE